MNSLIEIKHKLKNGQDIWRASTVRALVALLEVERDEVKRLRKLLNEAEEKAEPLTATEDA